MRIPEEVDGGEHVPPAEFPLKTVITHLFLCLNGVTRCGGWLDVEHTAREVLSVEVLEGRG